MQPINRREFGRTSLAGVVSSALRAAEKDQKTSSDSFVDPPNDAKMILYYWWFGPSQTEAELLKEMEAMRAAGVGGIFIFPVYPLSADDRVNYPYLSDRFLEVLRFTAEKARQLSLTVDLLAGGGWPFGGPQIPLEKSSRKLIRVPIGRALEQGDELVATDQRSNTAFVSSPTRQRIKSAVIDGEGWVLDHLNRDEVDRYLREVGGRMLSRLPKGSLRSINYDSLEAFQQVWTPDFPAQFQKRRNYDLVPHLAALWEDAGEKTLHIRYDYWRTLTDLFIDNFQKPFHEWSRQRGIALQGKPMGTPVNDLRAFADLDLAVAEEFDWLEFSGPRWAASGAHVYGQNLVANEGYTWLRNPRYITTLQDLKVGSDVQFLAGVNVIIGHGFPYSPAETGVPGWSYYAAVYFHPKNTWWPYVHHLMKYVQRVSFLMQQGVPVADVALFLPEDDEMADSAAGRLNHDQKVIIKTRLAKRGDTLPQFGLETALHNRSPLVSTIVTNGYSFDGINNDALQKARVVGNRLKVGQGSYGVLVLPDIRGLELKSMEKIQAFSRAGGAVIAIGQTPSMCYGFQERQERTQRVQEVSAEVFGPGGRGRQVKDPQDGLLQALREANAPDIDFERADPEVGFVHRKTATEDYYLIVNTTDQTKQLRGMFRIGNRRPEFWDPIKGSKRIASKYEYREKGTSLGFRLLPYQSVVVAFGRARGKSTLAKSAKPRKDTTGSPLSLPGPWTLEADGHSVSLDKLHSWTEIETIRYFSGTAVYHSTFDVGAGLLSQGQALHLSLGAVHEIADVELNGQAAGVAWMTPYLIDVTGKLQPGKNTISIKVTNLLINRVLGQPKPDVRALTEKFGAKLAQVSAAKDLKFEQNRETDVIQAPLPSGLLGPVEIRPVGVDW